MNERGLLVLLLLLVGIMASDAAATTVVVGRDVGTAETGVHGHQLQQIMDQLNQFNPLWARAHVQATLDKLDVIEDMPSAEAQALVRETRDLFAQLNTLCRKTGVALNDLLSFIDRFKADLRNHRLAV